jgi:hypothetical protein
VKITNEVVETPPMTTPREVSSLQNVDFSRLVIGDSLQREENLERRRSIFDTIKDSVVKKKARSFFSSQNSIEDEATLLAYAGNHNAKDLEERFMNHCKWNPIMAGIIAHAIVAYRDNPGLYPSFPRCASSLLIPLSLVLRISNPTEFGFNLRSETSTSSQTYGIRDFSWLNSVTLEQFLMTPSGDTIEAINADLLSYNFFEGSRRQILNDPTLQANSEGDLQNYFFKDEQVSHGTNILELTNRKFDPPQVADFRKLNFAGKEGSSKLPDFTLRIGDEIQSSTSSGRLSSSISSPIWRLCPWSVIAYVELKKWSEDLSRHVHQALYYAESTLLCCPGRRYCVTALYNFRSVIFCAALVSDGKLYYFASALVTDEAASREIAKFVSCERSVLGFIKDYDIYNFPPAAPLGRGSTAVCVSLNTSEWGSLALKISRDPGALATERAILNYLHSCESPSTLKIPTIPPESSQILKAIFGDHHSYASVLRPIYSRVEGNGYLNHQQLLDVWETLSKVHQFGICHRDVRLPNIGVINSSLHLMDWSSAKPFRNIDSVLPLSELSFHRGSTCTASIPVLRRMENSPHAYDCFPSDEAISMIYLAFQCVAQDKDYERPHDFLRAAADIWRTAYQTSFDDVTRESISALEQMTENDQQPQKINQLVRRAINALFSTETATVDHLVDGEVGLEKDLSDLKV